MQTSEYKDESGMLPKIIVKEAKDGFGFAIELNYCSNCGEALYEFYNFCPKCSTKIKREYDVKTRNDEFYIIEMWYGSKKDGYLGSILSPRTPVSINDCEKYHTQACAEAKYKRLMDMRTPYEYKIVKRIVK